MENQVVDGGVDTPVVDMNEASLAVDKEASQDQTTPPADKTEDQQEDKTQAEKTFTQKELDEILEKKTAKIARQRDKERAQREATQQELNRYKPAYVPTGEPQESQFENAKEYAKAYAKWEFEQFQQGVNAQKAQKAEATFKERVSEFREELEDIPEANFEKLTRLPLSDAAIEALLDSDMRTKLAVHLLANKADVERISQMSPARQASELGKLEAKLSTVAPKKISNAPAPITPVGGKGSVVSEDLYDPKFQANTDAWIAAYNKKQTEKRKR